MRKAHPVTRINLPSIFRGFQEPSLGNKPVKKGEQSAFLIISKGAFRRLQMGLQQGNNGVRVKKMIIQS
jgi:hypothetical protein